MLKKIGGMAIVVIAVGCGRADQIANNGGGDGGTQQVPAAVSGSAATSGSRLKLQMLVGEDGARLPGGLWDSKRNEACGAVTDKNGQLRCMPTATAGTVYYLDASCTQRAVQILNENCLPKYAIEYIMPEAYCKNPAGRIYSVTGTPMSVNEVYINQQGACSKYAVPSRVMTLGPEIDPSEFVGLTRATLN